MAPIDEVLIKPRRRSPEVTAAMAAQIRTMYFVRRMLQHDIAAMFRINQGRVSEVVNGKRFPEGLPAAQSSLPF
jgi:hypothetical protein